jgi:predicted permease
VRKVPHDRNAVREAVLLVIGCIVTLVWATATIVSVAFPDRPVQTEVHLIMLAFATSAFGGAAIAGRKANGNGKPKESNGG